MVSNLGAKPVSGVVAEVLRSQPGVDGEVVLASTPLDLEPLRTLNAGVVNQSTEAFYACRFSWRGNGKGLRGSASLHGAGSELIDALPTQ